LTSDCDNKRSVTLNDADVNVKALELDRNEATTDELKAPIELDAERKLAVAETSTDAILDVKLLNEDVVVAMTSRNDELNSFVIANVTFELAPPSINDKPVPAVRARSALSEPVNPMTTYDAFESPEPPVAVDEIVTCPFEAEAIVTFVPATRYDDPPDNCCNDPESPFRNVLLPVIDCVVVRSTSPGWIVARSIGFS